jgi:hypothetical protein
MFRAPTQVEYILQYTVYPDRVRCVHFRCVITTKINENSDCLVAALNSCVLYNCRLNRYRIEHL